MAADSKVPENAVFSKGIVDGRLLQWIQNGGQLGRETDAGTACHNFTGQVYVSRLHEDMRFKIVFLKEMLCEGVKTMAFFH